MILNHASLLAPGSDRSSISAWLGDVAAGMGQLVADRVAEKSLRMSQGINETWCLPDYSLWDAFNGLRESGFRDEYLFLVRLATKVPLLSETDEDVKDRFLACEEQTLPQGDGEPLVFCVIVDGIAIGFPSQPAWDRDRVTVSFNELLPDESDRGNFRGDRSANTCGTRRPHLRAAPRSNPRRKQSRHPVGKPAGSLSEPRLRSGCRGQSQGVRESVPDHCRQAGRSGPVSGRVESQGWTGAALEERK